MKLGKKLLKKAFTLVELVVVVAIIAILSAVSVAVYVGITDRTKTEADRANVSEWNTLLKVETVEGTLNNVIEVKDYFKDQGFGDEDFIPRTNGYGYYYCLDNNTMYLVDDSDTDTFDVTYPEDTIGEVNEGNSYRLNNTYCALNSSIDGVTFSRNALIVGQDNEVGIIANTMPNSITINSTDYTVTSGKITLHPENSDSLNATSCTDEIFYDITVKFLPSYDDVKADENNPTQISSKTSFIDLSLDFTAPYRYKLTFAATNASIGYTQEVGSSQVSWSVGLYNPKGPVTLTVNISFR